MNAQVDSIRLHDHAVDYAESVEDFFQTSRMGGRDRASLEAKLVYDFKRLNLSVLNQYGVDVRFGDPDGRGRKIIFSTSEYIGACPLRSPLSGRWDYRLVIMPRIGWTGLGGMLTSMGWKILPELQQLPTMKQSAKEIPNWVIASVIISRIDALLKDVSRKYIQQHELLQAPRGRVDWQEYAARQLPQLKWTEVPCDFSQFGDDPNLMGVINFVLRKVSSSLESVRDSGSVIGSLERHVQSLLRVVSSYPVVKPTPRMLLPIFYGRATPTLSFKNGLEAIQWGAEDRGLAGLSDLHGLPWRLCIADFFEAYIETLMRRVAVYTGGSVTTGRGKETVMPISWDESRLGTQKSLRPDVVLRRHDEVVIVDAKFKGYWRQISTSPWGSVDELARASHREDVLQVLAYSSCFAESKLTVCLVYACEKVHYDALRSLNALHRIASVRRGDRKIRIVLTAVPMQGNLDEVAVELARVLKG